MSSEMLSSPQTEAAVLGIVYQRGDQCADAFELEARDFTDERNRSIWRAVLKLHARKNPIDILTICNEDSSIDQMYMVSQLSDALVSTAQLPHYVGMLKQMTARRDFTTLSEHIASAANADEFNAAELSERIRLYLKKVSICGCEETAIGDELIKVYESMFNPPEQQAGVPTGIRPLDAIVGSFKAGRLYVVGARPSVGKTAFALHAAVHGALAGKRVLIINREMEKGDLIKRMIALMSDIGMNALEKGVLSEAQQEALVDIVGALGSLSIHIANTARTPAQIRTAACELHEKQPLDLIVVDYLQRIYSGGKYRTRDEEIGAISMALKDLAMELNVPVLLLSQLNRTAVSTSPTMSMLRESGNIEQDADAVMLLHTPDEQEIHPSAMQRFRLCQQQGGKFLEIIVDKNRHGKTGMTAVCFLGEKMRYMPFEQ